MRQLGLGVLVQVELRDQARTIPFLFPPSSLPPFLFLFILGHDQRNSALPIIM